MRGFESSLREEADPGWIVLIVSYHTSPCNCIPPTFIDLLTVLNRYGPSVRNVERVALLSV